MSTFKLSRQKCMWSVALLPDGWQKRYDAHASPWELRTSTASEMHSIISRANLDLVLLHSVTAALAQ